MTKWTKRFMDLSNIVGGWSKDPDTKVGAVLVSPDRLQIIVGYNGFPRGVMDTPERLYNRELKNALTIHGEHNAILNCPVRPVGWTLYCALSPCLPCSLVIIQSGITRVVAPELDREYYRFEDQLFARNIMMESGIENVTIRGAEVA